MRTQSALGRNQGRRVVLSMRRGWPNQTARGATALDGDIGENLALASGGTTMRGTMSGSPASVIDGVHTATANW